MSVIDTQYHILFSILIIVSATGCISAPQGNPKVETPTLNVVATIYPLQYFTTRIGGEKFSAIGIINPGVDAHTAELTIEEIHKLSNADVVISNGLGMEPWLEKAIKSLGSDIQGRVVRTASEVLEHNEHGHSDTPFQVLEHNEHRHTDPHFWLDPILATAQAKTIADALINADKSNKDYYSMNLVALIEELHELDKEFEVGLSNCQHNEFVISHDALGYLAARYDIKQLPIAGLSHDTAPSAGHIAKLIDKVDHHGLKAILVESLHENNMFTETILAETGAKPLDVHVIGNVTTKELTDHGDYFGLMRDNLQSLKTAMVCHD